MDCLSGRFGGHDAACQPPQTCGRTWPIADMSFVK
jgi:hypothetical protein